MSLIASFLYGILFFEALTPICDLLYNDGTAYLNILEIINNNNNNNNTGFNNGKGFLRHSLPLSNFTSKCSFVNLKIQEMNSQNRTKLPFQDSFFDVVICLNCLPQTTSKSNNNNNNNNNNNKDDNDDESKSTTTEKSWINFHEIARVTNSEFGFILMSTSSSSSSSSSSFSYSTKQQQQQQQSEKYDIIDDHQAISLSSTFADDLPMYINVLADNKNNILNNSFHIENDFQWHDYVTVFGRQDGNTIENLNHIKEMQMRIASSFFDNVRKENTRWKDMVTYDIYQEDNRITDEYKERDETFKMNVKKKEIKQDGILNIQDEVKYLQEIGSIDSNLFALIMQEWNTIVKDNQEVPCNPIYAKDNPVFFDLKNYLDQAFFNKQNPIPNTKLRLHEYINLHKKGLMSEYQNHLPLKPDIFFKPKNDKDWSYFICPEVREYFEINPYFDYEPFDLKKEDNNIYAPTMSTEATIKSVCLLKIIQMINDENNIMWSLYAGGSLGAFLHGGPIPWDDDIDIIMNIKDWDLFIQKVKEFRIPELPNFRLDIITLNSLKIFIRADSLELDLSHLHFKWPYIDIFFYQDKKHFIEELSNYDEILNNESSKEEHLIKINSFLEKYRDKHNRIEELNDYNETYNKLNNQQSMTVTNTFLKNNYFPTRKYLFGGLLVPGPPNRAMISRYDVNLCRIGGYSHRVGHISMKLEWKHRKNGYNFNCCTMKKHLPFIHKFIYSDNLNNNKYEIELTINGNKLIHAFVMDSSTQKIVYSGFNISKISNHNISKLTDSTIDNNNKCLDIIATTKTDTDIKDNTGNNNSNNNDSNFKNNIIKTSIHYTNPPFEESILHNTNTNNYFVNDESSHSQEKSIYNDPFVSSLQTELPTDAWKYEFAEQTWQYSQQMRNELLSYCGKQSGAELTKTLINLDKVEIDNSITGGGSISKCKVAFEDLTTNNDNNMNSNLSSPSSYQFKVIEFNAERGTTWHLTAQKILNHPSLSDADIIILNEMDIGMARSENLHTTRMLAYALQMNYVWGLEFVELTNGDKSEQFKTHGKLNLLGLHGNAILSKYCFNEADTSIITSINIDNNNNNNNNKLYIGSVHKVTEPNHLNQMKELNKNHHAIYAGDQGWGFCDQVGLRHVDDKNQHTWPADKDCKSMGNRGHRGDIICSSSNSITIGKPETLIPCYFDQQRESLIEEIQQDVSISSLGINKTMIQLSDHSMTLTRVELPIATAHR